MKNIKNIIGIGSFGCHMAHYFNKQNYPADYIYICDEQDQREYAGSGYSFRHFDHSIAGSLSSDQLLETPLNEPGADYSNKAEYIISCACESQADFITAKAIISKLKQSNSSYFVFLHHPFYSAGDKKRSRLQELEHLIENPQNLIKIDRKIYAKYGDMKFNDAFEAVYEEMMGEV